MSPGLLKCTKKQKRLYRKTISKNSTETDELKYKEHRNKLSQILRRTKEEYYRNKCSEFKRNTSKLWKMINKLTHNMNDKSSAIEYLQIGHIDIYDSKLIAEEFAKHFSSVGSRYANKITNPHNTFTHYIAKIPNNPKSMFMTPTSTSEIEKLITKLPNKKAKVMMTSPIYC